MTSAPFQPPPQPPLTRSRRVGRRLAGLLKHISLTVLAFAGLMALAAIERWLDLVLA